MLIWTFVKYIYYEVHSRRPWLIVCNLWKSRSNSDHHMTILTRVRHNIHVFIWLLISGDHFWTSSVYCKSYDSGYVFWKCRWGGWASLKFDAKKCLALEQWKMCFWTQILSGVMLYTITSPHPYTTYIASIGPTLAIDLMHSSYAWRVFNIPKQK